MGDSILRSTDFDGWRREIALQVRDGLITADEAAQKLGLLAALEAADLREYLAPIIEEAKRQGFGIEQQEIDK